MEDDSSDGEVTQLLQDTSTTASVILVCSLCGEEDGPPVAEETTIDALLHWKENLEGAGFDPKYKVNVQKFVGRIECWNCGKTGHTAREFSASPREPKGLPAPGKGPPRQPPKGKGPGRGFPSGKGGKQLFFIAEPEEASGSEGPTFQGVL